MPTPTRLDAETTLYSRWSGGLAFVFQRTSADPITGAPVDAATNRPILPTGTTALYNDPLAYGLQLVGVSPGNPAAIADGDVSLASARWVMFADLAEYRLIQSLLGSFTDTTESDFGRSVDYAKLADRWQKRLDALTGQYQSFLNPYRAGASSGAIRSIPATAFPPRWSPGYGGPAGRGPGRWGC